MNKPLIARKRSTGCIPTRYVLAILGHIGFANVYALRVNLSVAIIDMKVKSHAIDPQRANANARKRMGVALVAFFSLGPIRLVIDNGR